MNRQEKIEKRKQRSHKRLQKRLKKLEDKKRIMDNFNCGLGEVRYILKYGYRKPWPDSDSPTGYSQHCSYSGTCQYPCNGDC